MPDRSIPLSSLDYGAEEEAAVLRVLRSRWLSMGPEVERFETEFAEFIGAHYAIAVTNATSALQLAYLALGVSPGDEIIQPAVNFVAAANAALAVRATPVFADIIDIAEPTLDPADVVRRIGPRTRAVVAMHYGGYLCRMSELREICERRRLSLIEDACHAVGARYLDPLERAPHGKMAGNLGDVACFSFFSNKNLATGEGGMVVTDRRDVAERCRLLRSHGMTTLTWDRHRGHASSYDVVSHGFNFRFDEIRAALGRVQLAKLPTNNARRRELVQAYRAGFASLPGWTIPFAAYAGESACHLMVVIAQTRGDRERMVTALKEARIQTSLHYPCIPKFQAFRRFPSCDLERSRAFAQRAITLPLFPTMTTQQVEEVCRVFRNEVVSRASDSGEWRPTIAASSDRT